MCRFIRRHAADCTTYADLHRWSCRQPTEFWRDVARFCGLKLRREADTIVRDFDRMPGARWFDGAKLSYAENLLAGAPDQPVIVFGNESGKRRELTRAELKAEVASMQSALKALGVGVGDRVAGILPNCPESIVAMLAATSLGAVWSSCSPDFGSASLLDRLGQIAPKLVFGIDGYAYAGKRIDCLRTLQQVVDALPSTEAVIMLRYLDEAAEPPRWSDKQTLLWPELAADGGELACVAVEFDHPLFIMFSSGTTGPPKCIVHGAGGTLLQHLKEHQLHSDIHPGDRVFYYTTTGWMMWNWLVSALASGATLVLYDGAPMHPDAGELWRFAEFAEISVFGTSARYLSALEKSGFVPASQSDFPALKAILSTGSPLPPASFDFVYGAIKKDLQLASIAGGTDLISCFVLGNPMLPVWRGEIQCAGLGMDVAVFDADGEPVVGEKGELVCRSPFPSMPVSFFNDASGELYRRAYFDRYPGVWHHGDFAEITGHGGVIMYGRSDATLNPGGIRIGTAEIYRILDDLPGIEDAVVVGQAWDGDTRIVLFVVMADGAVLDRAAEQAIRQALRAGASPHHVPARIVAVSDIPRTLSGKISERAVVDAIHGRIVANETALANPSALDQFRNLEELGK